MEDLYRNLIVSSYPSYPETLELINSWDAAHQNLFTQQMQVLLDAQNLDAEITPADAAEITQEFAEIYDDFLQKNRELNLQRFSELSANSSNAQDFSDAHEIVQQSIAVTLQRQQESMHTRYGQMLDEFRQKAAGVKQYSWATAGDEKVRASHDARDGQLFDWNDSPTPGQEANCRCSALPASFEEFTTDDYGPAEDSVYIFGYYTYGQLASYDLGLYDELISEQAKTHKIDPSLIKGIITNEIITRAGAAGGEAIVSGINSLFNDRGNGGTYGPAQLGRAARRAANLTILDSLSYDGAIRGAANWLGIQKIQLTKVGILNPTNAQIASRYNKGSAVGEITDYGVRVQFLIDRLYSR